jgi:sortase B
LSERDKKKRYKRVLITALIVLLLGVAAFAIFQIVSIQLDYSRAKAEYDALKELATDTPVATNTSTAPTETLERAPDLSDINPDYVGWIRIDGTAVDYPVVRGTTNDQYLATTFRGEENPSGSIFMDARCEQGFSGAITIIYGHNMNDGSMFAQLKRYPEGGTPEQQETITILTPHQDPLLYRIFAVVTTNTSDSIYTLPGSDQKLIADYMTSHGAPQGARQFLVLSTCTSRGDDTERRLLFATSE